MEDLLVICIPTYRKPPIKTLQHYSTKYPVMVIADPNVLEEYKVECSAKGLHLASGKEGMSAQVAECYRRSYHGGWKWYFRLDDDLEEKSFVHKEKGRYPTLDEVIDACLECAIKTNTTLAGLANTTNRYWMGEGYGRTYGLIHGAAHICRSAEDPSEFIDTNVQYFEDVYRSLAHRKKDGAVGRVKFIGIDKRGSSERVEEAALAQTNDIELILKTFPGMVTCEGVKEINNGKHIIANWRYKK